MIPHHGAARNFNAGLADFGKARCFVTVNANDSKRPHRTVVDTIGDLAVVSEDEASCITEVSGPPALSSAWQAKVSEW
jgi:hypothetical protein